MLYQPKAILLKADMLVLVTADDDAVRADTGVVL